MHTIARIVVTGASVAALTAAVPHVTMAAPATSGADTEILATMQRDLGMSATQVTRLRTRQDKAIRLNGDLRASLGTAFAGSWLDTTSGTLVVNVTDSARAAEVSKAGARAQLVKHSQANLDAIQSELNTVAGTKTTSRATVSPTAGLASWKVDPRTNSVVVSVVRGQRPAVLDSLARHGDAVTVEYVDQAPQTTKWMNGGEEIQGDDSRCSAGFNATRPATGETYLLTAGHCVEEGEEVDGEGGRFFGTTTESWFPHWDHALIRAENTGYWQQGPFVQSASGYVSVGQPEDLPVNTYVCKSGITTKWTCGFIIAKNVTVQYAGQSEPVYYLTQSNACSEPGDSGGATVAATTVWLAEGMTSGAALVEVDGRMRCLSAIGEQNVSYYYPVAKAMEWYGPEIGLQLM